jgi:hypothetical protein
LTRAFYEQVADALVGFLPPALRDFQSAVSARNLKIWFDEPREHYEVQTIRAGRAKAMEIGFHAEHSEERRNEAALDKLSTRSWRRALGAEAEAGAFLGRQSAWRRLSEVWKGPGLGSDEAAIEAAHRVSAYIKALEPQRRRGRRP